MFRGETHNYLCILILYRFIFIQVKKPRDVSSNKTTPFKPTVVNLSEANFNFGGVKCPKTVPRISPKSVVSSVVKKSTPNAVRRKSTSNTAAKKPLSKNA